MNIKSKYSMTISLNVLNHLGISLYSSIPAVLSEVVANAWDADASEVNISISPTDETINIIDDGHGMSMDDLNNKYLHIGYQRRKSGDSLSPKYNRSVMGRKGIGKLSLFSISERVEVHSVKDGVKSGLILDINEIRSLIESSDKNTSQHYYPEEVLEEQIEINNGTKIILNNINTNLSRTTSYLTKNLARRFSIIGLKHNFKVKINENEVSVEDRNYFSKIQYLWTISHDSNEISKLAVNAKQTDTLNNSVSTDKSNYSVSGWIGSLKGAGDTKEQIGNETLNLNNISIIVRGKSAQEDVLQELGKTGIYTKYLVGEIHADFLDDDNDTDIATSGRQKLIEYDPRYIALKDYLNIVISDIGKSWLKYRNLEGENEAKNNPLISEWLNTLNLDSRKTARNIFGKINQMPIDINTRNEFFKQSVIVVEHLRYKGNLQALDKLELITPENIDLLSSLFSKIDDVEAYYYHKITKDRMKLINTLETKVDDDAKEKVIQKHLFDHLWLLDPAWERAAEDQFMEKTVKSAFEDVDSKSLDLNNGRIDIRYKTSAGMHIIVELKRPSVNATCIQLLDQVDNYIIALQTCLNNVGRENEIITVVCVVGTIPNDYSDRKFKMLSANNIRVKTYSELLNQAYSAYADYLNSNKEVSRFSTLLDNLFPNSEI